MKLNVDYHDLYVYVRKIQKYGNTENFFCVRFTFLVILCDIVSYFELEAIVIICDQCGAPFLAGNQTENRQCNQDSEMLPWSYG